MCIRDRANTVEKKATFGTCFGPPTRTFPLKGKSGDLGAITIWAEDQGEEIEKLLDSASPTVSLALENALSYRTLEDYRENLEKKVDDRTVELREAQAVREQIFANINHELRTPLSLIQLASTEIEELTKKSSQEPGIISNRVAAIRSNSNQLVTLVDDLLLLSASQ